MPESKAKKVTSKGEIAEGVFTGKFTPTNLPTDLYHATAERLVDGVKESLKKADTGFKFDEKSAELAAELSENVYMFSGAKTFQQTLEMSEALTDDEGNRKSFEDFKADAADIYEKYNGPDVENPNPEGWLRAEYDLAITEGRMVEKWLSIEANKADFPNLMYQTTGDDAVCEICGPLDGIILPADDPFWDDNSPPNHFGCYCTIVQMDEETTDEQGGVDDWDDIREDVEGSMEQKNPMFNHNSARQKEVFKSTGKDKHPYFKVPKQYREFAKSNFGLRIPNTDDE